MNARLFAGGAVVVLLAVSMNAGAYHITGVPGQVAGPSAHTYESVTYVGDLTNEPCNWGGQIQWAYLLAVTTLEALPFPLGGPGGVLTLLLGDGCLFAPPMVPGQT